MRRAMFEHMIGQGLVHITQEGKAKLTPWGRYILNLLRNRAGR